MFSEIRIEIETLRPLYCGWELTLACNLKCIHCGSQADKKRVDELSTQECLNVVSQLAKLRATNWKGEAQYWSGCQGGRKAIGIESNGNIKGFLSIQPGYKREKHYHEGNVRKRSLKSIWFDRNNFTYNRTDSNKDLKGFCKKCINNPRCRGGSKCMSLAMTGKPQGSPYCYYQVSHHKNNPQDTLVRNSVAATGNYYLLNRNRILYTAIGLYSM